MKKTEEYTMLIFSLAKTLVEDVEKVWQVTKLFLESGHVIADKDSTIALNKNLRNSELKQFALNIVKYNRKENLDVESYLMTVFGEWFTGKKIFPRTIMYFRKIHLFLRMKLRWNWNVCIKT